MPRDFLNKRLSVHLDSPKKKDMSKKVLFIGDIHGRTDWRETANEGLKKFQEVVLLGDYWDSFDVSPALQKDNFYQILSFIKKKKNVTALLGNHDYAYIHAFSSISGYQFSQAPVIKNLLDENKETFKIAWGYEDDKGNYTLATHAGLTYGFWKKVVLPLFEEGEFLHQIFDGKEPGEIPIHETLNALIDKKWLMWRVGPRRGGSSHPSPLWTDYHELIEDPFPGINQVFGHTVNHSPSLDFTNDGFLARIDNFGPKTSSLVIGI